ncbi:MAG: SPOR domain-containing protein [Candidatus Rokuibacteriota bacterium]
MSASAAADSTPKTASASAPAGTRPATTKPAAPRQARAGSAPPAPAGPYWVQVGAFKDEETAKRLAASLRAQNFKVAEVIGTAAAPAAAPAPAPAAAPAGTDQYDVFVTGLPPAELTTRLTAKGLAAETSGAGVVIRPSLPLRDAVALSKDLAVEGFKVQVRRAGGEAARASARPPAPAAATATATAGDGLYRVRVGSFAGRPAAVAALRELQAKGYKPFIARGER